ncbi:MAG: alpha/beta hydrolase [Dongiaceae bacterium]
MTLHPKLKEVLALPPDPNEIPVEIMAPADARTSFDKDLKGVDGLKPDVFRISDGRVRGAAGDLAMRVYEPAAGTSRPSLIYFHGGGYIRGSLETHDSSCRIIANNSQAVVFSVDYRLSPEAKFPVPLEDCYTATVDIVSRAREFGIDPKRIAVGGDSAGGNFAAGVTLLAAERGGPALKFQLLIYPNVDLGAQTESIRLFSKGYFLNSMPFYIASYTKGPKDIEHPLCSPLRARDLSVVPPAYVLTCGFDPLRDEGQAYAARLKEAGVAVEQVCYDDMIHGFLLLRALLPEADEALAACGRAVARGLAA